MQIDQLIKGIKAKFSKNRLVFWYDPEQSFSEEILSIAIDGVTLLDMSGVSVFETKKRIELDDPANQFLLYFPYAEPEAERDWLLDIRLYSEQFFADASSMLLNELGIPKMALRSHIRSRESFFTSKQRLAALKRFVTEDETAASLDRKMLAVVTKADSASLTDIIFQLIKSYSEALLAGSNDVELQQCDKFGLLESLWLALKAQFSYESTKPSIEDFVLKLFCTEFWSQIDADDRDWLLNNVLKTGSGRATALAFMTGWRDSRSFADSHDVISKIIAQQLEIDSRCQSYHPVQIMECDTFEVVEQAIIRGLVGDLLDPSHKLDRVQFDRVLSRRLVSHWCLSRKEYTAIYEALRNAEQLFYLRQQFVDGFHYDSSQSMYEAYVKELYLFDQSYRLFNEHVASVLSKGADILRQLDDEVENLYTHWYLYELALGWDRLIESEQLLGNWKIEGIPQQHRFYETQVVSRLRSKQTKRLFVIISDALRYEVAQELTLNINGEKRFKAELGAQLGVLPSYTQLGMAALLPHKSLSYETGKSSIVYADGQSTQGLDNRNSVLETVKGIAVNSKELMSWSNQEGRDNVKDANVVYIYHDTIDAMGDKLSTEEKTFDACRTAVDELKNLVGRVINRLNGSRVLVTADHGFLFQQKALSKADKTVLPIKPVGTIEAKKRYIIGESLPVDESCWKGKIADTANGCGETEFLIPKGAQRFHFVGGARFVHGGAMLQEICVPIISISALRGEKMEQHQKQPVGVVVKTQPIKIVNNIDKISFIQTNPMGDRFIARQLDVFIIDSEGQEVSSRETVNFDSQNSPMDERTRDVRLKLIGSEFNRHKAYTLVLENTVTQTRYSQYGVTIDLAFTDDFF
ncbi:MAG: BREX-1 system phosphatase PglZ type A [Methyloprofundus sp.]|nr:BREX-1 system phosphatase PglZ type A [Methyloprofundus sp.]